VTQNFYAGFANELDLALSVQIGRRTKENGGQLPTGYEYLDRLSARGDPSF